MPGYQIFEKSYLRTYRANGIEPHSNKMGILDFLRDVKHEISELPKFSKYQVVGIDDLLYMAEAEERRNVAHNIHRQLGSVAQDLQRKLMDVQIVCKGKLIRGDSLTLKYRDEVLPIDLIFGDLIKQVDAQKNEFYLASFNLTSG